MGRAMRTVLVVSVFVLGTGVAVAAPVACPSSSTLATLISYNAGGGCYSQDKIFSNFSYTSQEIPSSSVNTSLKFQQSGGQDQHGWTFTSNWTQDFTLSYTITVCTSQAQGCVEPSVNFQIFAASVQINAGLTPNDAAVATTAGSLNLPTSGASLADYTNQGFYNPAVSSVDISSTFDGSGTATLGSLEHIFYERDTSIPEPATYALLGAGLLGFALSRRKIA